MNQETENHMIDTIVVGSQIVEKFFKQNFDVTTDAGKMFLAYGLSVLLSS